MQKQYSTRRHKRYEQPTIASKSRSPSPYTKRRMCQLTEDSKQRLAHFNMEPFEFKKETEYKPPFVIRHTDTCPSPDSLSTRGSLKSGVSFREHNNLSALDSYRPSRSRDSQRMHIDDLRVSYKVPFSQSVPPSVRRLSPSPVLSRTSLRERFQSDRRSPVSWEEIHARVKNLLRTHRAWHSLLDKTDTWNEPYSSTIRKRVSPHREKLHDRIVSRKNQYQDKILNSAR